MASSSLQGALGNDTSAPARWYGSGASELRQLPYKAQSPFTKEPNVYFCAPNGGPILLEDIVHNKFTLFGANYPWTASDTVGQKISVRLLLRDNSAVRQINVRRENEARDVIKMEKLAEVVARAVYQPLMDYCATTGLRPEYLILAGLEHIAQGSWKPIIYVKSGP